MALTQGTLSDGMIASAPSTEGVKYAGSKLKLLPHILHLVGQVKPKTVLDGFSGTTRVSQALAKSGYTVIANDVAVWSAIFGTCYLCSTHPKKHYDELITHLNATQPKDGWFTEQYGGYPNSGSAVQNDGLKKPWQIHNTRKLDAIREEITHLNLDTYSKAVALTSLILALDEVDNTIGHYAAYLQNWSPRSFNTLFLRVPAVIQSKEKHTVLQDDIFTTVKRIEPDMAYFDPPYGSNNEKMPPSRVRYAAYYHLWTTICLDDKPTLFGKAKRRADTSDTIVASPFEDFRKDTMGKFIAVNAIDRLIAQTQAPWILLSYSSGGRATAEELYAVLQSHGTLVKLLSLDYKKNVMADMCWTNAWTANTQEPHKEFLFLLKKK